MCAGEIPRLGDFIVSRGWSFEIIDADPKRILSVKVERLLGAFNDEDDKEYHHDGAVLGYLEKENIEDADIIAQKVTSSNADEARSIERLVDISEKKRSAVKEMIAESKQR